MNRLAPCDRDSAKSPRCSSASIVDRHMAAAVARHRRTRRGRPAARSAPEDPAARPSSTRAAARSRCRPRPRRPAPRAATACSRHTAPAVQAPRPHRPRHRPGRTPQGRAAADAATSRRPRCDAAPAAARAPMPSCGSLAPKPRPQTDAPAAAARCDSSKPQARCCAQRRGKLVLGDARDLKRKPRRRRRNHLLPRHARRLREHRAQALVTPHQVVQRARKRRAVQRTRQAAPQPGSNRSRAG